ncbi:MAG: hypothetical protein IJ799_03250 [Bacteroidales bacterium]|nr:hypothetical protein [Bacteroidales bacterium]
MKRLSLLVPIIAVMAAACTRPEEKEPETPSSKDAAIQLTLSSDSFRGPFSKGDAVSVLDNTGNHKFVSEADGASASFSGQAYAKALERIVISPYTPGAVFDTDSIMVSVPAEQKGFNPISVGYGKTQTIRMQPVTAGLSFTLKSSDVSSIKIEGAAGESFTGSAKISLNTGSNSVSVVSKANGKALTLLPPDGQETLAAGEHKVSILPVSFPSGVKYTITHRNGKTNSGELTAEIRASIGVLSDLGDIEAGAGIEEPEPEPEPGPDAPAVQTPERSEPFDLELVFLETPESTTFLWPFASPALTEISGTFNNDKGSFRGVEKEFKLNDEQGGYVFKVFATSGVAKNSGSHQGFKFGGAPGDYILLPAIKGAYLTRITWTIGGTNTYGATVVRFDGKAVEGGEVLAPNGTTLGKALTWILYGSEKETAYKIQSGDGGILHFQKLLLHYETEAPADPSSKYQEIAPDQIPDFSRVGYHYGDRDIPDIPVKMTLEAPADGADATALIQNALNTVETPGAVLLKAGTYNISDIIRFTRSGVVLRGEGQDKTILYGTATTQIGRILQMGATADFSPGTMNEIIARYVPVGQMWVPVRNPEKFSVGDRVWIYRPATGAWLDALHMRELAALYPENVDWTTDEYGIYWERKVMKIEDEKIWLDNPVVMCIGGDESYGKGYLCKGSWKRISECGIENLSLDTRYDESKKSGSDYIDEDHVWSAIVVYATEHGWVRNITTRHFALSCVNLAKGSKNITVENCTSLSPVSSVEGGRRYAFHFSNSQLCLIKDCFCDGDRHQYVCGSRVSGPNVFLRCTATNARADAGPHQRWASGVLYDNVKTNHQLNVRDRGGSGTGHGWTGVNFVLYNCEASKLCVQSPWVTGQNWCIGCKGTKWAGSDSYKDSLGPRPDGIWQSHGTKVSPESLYEDQLAKRHAAGGYIDK